MSVTTVNTHLLTHTARESGKITCASITLKTAPTWSNLKMAAVLSVVRKHTHTHVTIQHLLLCIDGPTLSTTLSTGGAVTVALDQDALDEASEQDSELGTVDGFVSRLMEFPLLKKLRGKCQVEATLTDTSNLQLTLSAELSTEAKHCQSISEVSLLCSVCSYM